MTYRELLNLYKQGKLDDVRKKEVEAAIEKQDAISEFLYEEGEIPEFSDLESENAENPENKEWFYVLYLSSQRPCRIFIIIPMK